MALRNDVLIEVFHRVKGSRTVDFSLYGLKRQGHAGLASQPDLPFTSLQTALGLRPRSALSSAGALQSMRNLITQTIPKPRSHQFPNFARTRFPTLPAQPFQFCSHHDSRRGKG